MNEIALLKKASGRKMKTWNTDHVMPDGRTIEEYATDVIAKTMVSGDTEEKLSAVDLLLKMKNQNIMMQRIEQMDDGEEVGGGQVIVILPPNGTERIEG